MVRILVPSTPIRRRQQGFTRPAPIIPAVTRALVARRQVLLRHRLTFLPITDRRSTSLTTVYDNRCKAIIRRTYAHAHTHARIRPRAHARARLHKHVYKYTRTETDVRTDGQTYRQTDIQTYRQTDRRTDRRLANKQTIRALRLSFLRIFTRLGSAGTIVSFWRDLLLRFARPFFFLFLLSSISPSFFTLSSDLLYLWSRVFVFTRNSSLSRFFPLPFLFHPARSTITPRVATGARFETATATAMRRKKKGKKPVLARATQSGCRIM